MEQSLGCRDDVETGFERGDKLLLNASRGRLGEMVDEISAAAVGETALKGRMDDHITGAFERGIEFGEAAADLLGRVVHRADDFDERIALR